ncbi:hypothetical protein BC629DRAFT_1731573 [Irpex lacteus]|nr:hypothetical protein BC629DRAFT_1731573 [Irpex lacteus]
MFRLIQRIPARRLVHTSATRPVSSIVRGRAGLVLGASAVTAYVAWKATSQSPIALDSVAASSTPSSKPKAKSTDPVPTQRDSSAAGSSQSEVAPAEVVKKAEEAAESTEAAQTEGQSEEQSGGGGAFNPVTGEINWDCPCLGGMAYGPCGLQFREAFSCFVFSEKEPKGIECVEKFKAMQDCFREHPDVYADEIMDDDDDEEGAPAGEPTSGADSPESVPTQDTPKPSVSESLSASSHSEKSEPRTT